MPKPAGAGNRLPVFQRIAERGVGDVVGGDGEAIDLQQDAVFRQSVRIGQVRLDHFAVLKIVARNDELKSTHSRPRVGSSASSCCTMKTLRQGLF
ncbi:hypothetical protein [Rhodopseudomonas sp. RCAM05734]|uniref:hypothetical protein n=1 Tax=Rhodopseudomonas sp. RCAM05734 TaxID=3457549 RepID=UPI004044B906